MQKTKQQYLKAAYQYIELIKDHPDVIGIVISGGFLNDMIHKNSDVDLWIILKDECDYYERGVVWMNNIEVEYFMNPPRLIRKQFEREIRMPISANILVRGKLAYQETQEVEKLIEEARLHLNAQLPPMSDTNKKIAKHKLNDRYKDLEDVVLIGDFLAARLIKNNFVEYCINLFFTIHQIKKDKFKRIQPLIDTVDQQFTQLLDSCLSAEIEELEKAEKLKLYLEELLGGPNPKNWRLRGKAKP